MSGDACVVVVVEVVVAIVMAGVAWGVGGAFESGACSVDVSGARSVDVSTVVIGNEIL
jgi:hypothetical protein